MTDTPTEIDPSPASLKEWRAHVRHFAGRGMMLRAYDTAARALRAHPDDSWLKYRGVLAWCARRHRNREASLGPPGTRPRGAEFGSHPMPVVP